jgi:HK97 family phage prohead protease
VSASREPSLPKWPIAWVSRSRPPLDDDSLREWIKENIRKDGGVTYRTAASDEVARIERRVAAPTVERAALPRTRALDVGNVDAVAAVAGIVAPFGDIARIGGVFTEEYDGKAFRDQQGNSWRESPPVLGMWSHDLTQPLASVVSGTLKLRTTRIGLEYTMWPVPEGVGAYALQLVGRGDVAGSSAGFSILEDVWLDRDKLPHRVILRARLREVSLTPWPAYPAATAEPRAATASAAGRQLPRFVRVGDRHVVINEHVERSPRRPS